MKAMRGVLFIGLVSTGIWLAQAQEDSAIKKDLAALQGEWSMVSGSADGQPMPDEMRKHMKRICKGDEATTTMRGQVYIKAKITIDPSKNPKTINYDMIDGFTKGKKQLGIYELDGDMFKACFSAPGDERPKEFSTQPGDRRTLSVWKREEAAKSKPTP